MTVPPDRSLAPDRDTTTAPTRRELILAEEQLTVSTVRVPARRVRLEKYVVTETRTITVEVSHEEVRLVDIDLASDDVSTDDPVRGTGTGTGSFDVDLWMVLSEQRIAITTETVPVERVRLAVTSVVEDRAVTEQVRREQVAFDNDSTLVPELSPHISASTLTTTKDTA